MGRLSGAVCVLGDRKNGVSGVGLREDGWVVVASHADIGYTGGRFWEVVVRLGSGPVLI